MDLFPKDYKRNGSPMPAPPIAGAGGSFLSKLKGIKNKFSGGFSVANSGALAKAGETALRLGVIFSGIILVLALALWGGLVFYSKSLTSQINNLKKQQAEVFNEQDIKTAGDIVAFDKGAVLVQGVLKNHIYSSNIFNKLAAATLPRVQWQSFAASIKDKSINANGFASDYSFLAKQMIALEAEGFLNVKISKISLDKTGGVGFAAVFDFDPKILQK